MKLTIERAALIKALGHVQSVVERRNTIPILSNVLLSADKGGLAFSATDLDMEIVDETNAEVSGSGQITAPAHTLYEIVRKLPEGADVELKFQGEDPRLAVTAGRSKFNLPVLPAGDFPVMSSDGLSNRMTVDTEALIRLIDKTRFAISTEETRYYLNGLYVHSVMEDGEAKLRCVATDGHRLALAEMPAPEGSLGLPGVIVPRKTIAEARRLLEDAGETVELQISTAKVRFEFGRAALTSKVIDGAFPDYARVIPKENNRVVTIDTALFASAVDRVATISAEKSRSVKLADRAWQAGAHRPQHGSRAGRRGGGDRLRRRALRNRLQRPLPAGRLRPDRRRHHGAALRRSGFAHPGARPHGSRGPATF